MAKNAERRMLADKFCRSLRVGQRVWDNERRIFAVVADTRKNTATAFRLVMMSNENSVELCLEDNAVMVYTQVLKNIFVIADKSNIVDIEPDKGYIICWNNKAQHKDKTYFCPQTQTYFSENEK